MPDVDIPPSGGEMATAPASVTEILQVDQASLTLTEKEKKRNLRAHFGKCNRVRVSAVGQSNRLFTRRDRVKPCSIEGLSTLIQNESSQRKISCKRAETKISRPVSPDPELVEEVAFDPSQGQNTFDPLNPIEMVEAARWQREHPPAVLVPQKIEIDDVERIIPVKYRSAEEVALEARILKKKHTLILLEELKEKAAIKRKKKLEDPLRRFDMEANKRKEMTRRLTRQSTHAKELLLQLDPARLKKQISIRRSQSHGRLPSAVSCDDLKSLVGYAGCGLRADEIDRVAIEHASQPFSRVHWDDIDKIFCTGIYLDQEDMKRNASSSKSFLFQPRAGQTSPSPEKLCFDLCPVKLRSTTTFASSNYLKREPKSTSYLTQSLSDAPGHLPESQRFSLSRQVEVEAEKSRKRAIQAGKLAKHRYQLKRLEIYANSCNRRSWKDESARINSIRRQAARYETVFAIQAQRDIARANRRKGKRRFEGIKR